MHTWPARSGRQMSVSAPTAKVARRRSRPGNRADSRLAPAATLRLRPNHAAAWRTDRSNVSTLPGPRRSGRSGPSGRSQRPRLQARHTIAHDHATIAGPNIGAVAETNWLHGIGNQSQTARAFGPIPDARRRGVHVVAVQDHGCRQAVEVEHSADTAGLAMAERAV
jgi:hypothetical protein